MAWTMLLIIGTGHVFKIDEQVRFIIKNTWPDAVLVELDSQRLASIRSSGGKERDDVPWFYRLMANQQRRLADEFGGTVGGDMLAAVEAAEKVGADVLLIDEDASLAVSDLLKRMSAREKLRLAVSSLKGFFSSRKSVEKELEMFSNLEDEYLEEMRRSFPSLVKVLIDERNERMARRIRQAAERYENVLVVVGDAHVEGLASMLSDLETKKIRLKEIIDEDKMDSVRREILYGEAAKQ